MRNSGAMSVPATGPLVAVHVGVLVTAFGAAVALRVQVGGVGASQSSSAGLVFAGCLVLLALAAGVRLAVSWPAVFSGLGGGAVICGPVALGQLSAARPLHDAAGLGAWALVVGVVATAEEVFLRGALYEAVTELAGTGWAVGLGALAFAMLHVPLYGWHVLPLDLAVGVVLGGLRAGTGTWAAPAVAHVFADLAGWFLR